MANPYSVIDRFRKRKPDLNLPPLNPIYTTEPRYPTSAPTAEMLLSPPMNYRAWDRPQLDISVGRPPTTFTPNVPIGQPPMQLSEMAAPAGPPMTPPEDEDALRQEAEELERVEQETVEMEERHRQFELQKETERIDIETKNLKARNARIEAQQKALETAARSPSAKEALSWRRGDRVTGRSAGGAPSREDIERRYMSRYGEPPPEGWWTEAREPYAEGLEVPPTREELLARGIERYAERHPAGRERGIAGVITGRREAGLARIKARAAEARQRRLEKEPPTGWDVMRHKERLGVLEAAGGRTPTKGTLTTTLGPDGKLHRFLVDPVTGRTIQDLGVSEAPEAPEAPTRGTLTTTLGPDGKLHRFLVDPTTGETIQDLGVAEAPEAPGKPTIAGMRAKEAVETGAIPGTKEFEKIAGRTTEPFTQGRILQTLGELEAGGPQNMLGITIEFGSREDATDHVLKRLGPNWKQLAPEAEEIIDKKWPEEGKVKVGQIIVNPTTGERRKWNGKKWVPMPTR